MQLQGDLLYEKGGHKKLNYGKINTDFQNMSEPQRMAGMNCPCLYIYDLKICLLNFWTKLSGERRMFSLTPFPFR